MQYKVVDTSTEQGLRQAENLKARGWVIYRTGLFLVWFRKKGKK